MPCCRIEPVALAGVAGEHLALGRKHPRHIDVKIDRHRPSFAVDTFERIHEIEVRNLCQRGRRLPLPGCVVGAGGREARIAYQETGHLVIGDVVSRRGRENDLGFEFAAGPR